MIRIALFTALAQEHTVLRRLTPPWERLKNHTVRTYRKRFKSVICTLFETGMGKEAFQRAFELAFDDGDFDLVVSAGFAGSLDETIDVGAVCVGERFLALSGELPLKPERTLLASPTRPAALCFTRAWGLRRARVATVERVQDKRSLADAIGGRATLVDMETYHAAMGAAKRSVAFLSLRSVSDGLNDPIDFDLETLVSAEGHIQIHRVLREIGRSPRLLGSLITTWRRSRRAETPLAKALRGFLTLPSRDLRRIIQEQRVSVVPALESPCR